MVSNVNKSYDAGSIKKSRKDYYLLVVGHKPEGISTRLETAQACARNFAEKYKAQKISGDNVYLYRDADGEHLIYLEKIKRISMSYNPDDE